MPEAREECDCPDCSGAELDPQAFVSELTTAAGPLLAVEDPLEAELFGASFVALGGLAGDDFVETLSEEIVPAIAELSTPAALGLLLATAAVEPRTGAAAQARRLLATGLPAPAWADELSRPLTATTLRRYSEATGESSVLLCSFERSGRSHGFAVHVSHPDCDAAEEVHLFPGEALGEVIAMLETNTVEDLDPAEFRWQVERALDARAVHDREDGEAELDADPGDEDGPGHHSLALLLRARMGTLPEPSRPPARHGSNTDMSSLVEMLTQFAEHAPKPRRAPQPTKLPAKRKKSDGPAPIYQIKVGLRGAKPPIWRRLEIAADTSLSDLHHTIQTAFGWEDSHLHVFETPYGAYGVADRELGHRAEKPVTLEQVAPEAGHKLRYMYDFGDNWEHDIVVEKILERRPVPYPRCTAGRRAAPPDDCGGIWGYADLIDILADPSHPEHEDRLEQLALPTADAFDPSHFDPAEVTRLLTRQGDSSR
ncbi:plasmid pRiA4b ORF-3 family protein [Actinoplanes sp. CA-054009]